MSTPFLRLCLLVFLASWLNPNTSFGQVNYNSKKTVKVFQSGQKTPADVANLASDQFAQQNEFFDGLARPLQVIGKGLSVSGGDIIQPMEYDLMGRTSTDYLPYEASSNGGQYRADALPVGSTPGQQSAFYNQSGSAVAVDGAPFKRSVFEASPLGREIETGSFGSAWQPGGHTIKTAYRSNLATEGIHQFVWSNSMPQSTGIYADSQLGVTQTTDEHGATTIEYVNADGQPVLKMRQAYVYSILTGKTAAKPSPTDVQAYYTYTYYVYDDFDNLRAIIQPKGIDELIPLSDWNTGITSAFVRKWCFIYQYDARQRLISKRVPGGGNTYYVYNSLDQVVATSTDKDVSDDGTNWRVTKYDKLGRPVLTAIYQDYLTQEDFQSYIDTQPATAQLYETRTGATGYTTTASAPAVYAGEVQSYIYYDDYNYPDLTGSGRGLVAENGVTSAFGRLQGLVTGHAERVLGTNNWVTTKIFFDDKLQPVQIREENALTALGGSAVSRTTLNLDFQGRPVTKVFSQSGSGQTHTMRNTYAYDHLGHMWKETQQMDYDAAMPPVEIVVSQKTYNELGQLVDNKLHSSDSGTNFLQSVDYRYNIRGWLTSINNRDLPTGDDGTDVQPDLFGMELKYNDGLLIGGSQAQFNGNVAEAVWRTRNTNTGMILRGYSYKYDLMSRLTSADYAAYDYVPSVGWKWGTLSSDYSVSKVTYDDNGNILSMNRKGRTNALSNTTGTFGDLDKLVYQYDGNQLTGVDDLATSPSPLPHDFEDNGQKFQTSGVAEYEYDASGNLLRDDNKGIVSTTYNQLNLPEVITFTNNRIIRFAYTATGGKVSKSVESPGNPTIKTWYVNGFLYETNQTTQVTTTLSGPMTEGRVLRNPVGSAANWKYEYHIKDHLGNLRFAFRDEGGASQQRATAGMEPANSGEEEQDFQHVAETRLRDAVHARTGDYVARLSAKQARREGPSITRAVVAGDSIYAEVYGRYDHSSSVPVLLQAGALALGTAVAGSSGPLPTENPQVGTARRRGFPFLGISLAITPQLVKLGQKPSAEKIPQAYLRCRLYNRDSVLIATRIQPLRATSTDDWQELKTGIKADSAGYVTISLINESDTPAYFDDLALRLVDPAYLQENHYDPFGLNLVGIEGTSGQDSKFQFNGEEKQEDFALNWTHMGARFYDAQLGRWHVVDELADDELQVDNSPYAFVWNNPANYADPTGLQGGYGDYSEEYDKEHEHDDDHQDPTWSILLDEVYVADRYTGSSIIKDFDGIESTLDNTAQQGPNQQEPEPAKPTLEEMKRNPPNHPLYKSPKGGDKKVNHKNGKGWVDRSGRVWIPDSHKDTHGPHWDRQPTPHNPNQKDYDRIFPVTPVIDSGMREKIGEAVGLSGTALTIYLIISEGTRLFPPRNLVPIP